MAGKLTTEEVNRVDVRWMKRQGFLRPGASGVLRWHRGGEPTGSVGFTAELGCLRLSYHYRDPSGQWLPRVQEITVDRTRCNFGGTRPWFRCPACNRRVGVLYGVAVDYLCRHCYGLSYGSQQERELDRTLRRAREIRKRLDASDDLTEPIYDKPKGMHWKTFERLMQEQNELIATYDQAMAIQFGAPV